MIYLDTHIVVWLYAGRLDILTKKVVDLLNNNDIFVSPVVKLELQYLFEIKRINVESSEIVSNLSDLIGLKICGKNFNTVINNAIKVSWTRDSFDRLIVANAAICNDILLTKDQTILNHYPKATW